MQSFDMVSLETSPIAFIYNISKYSSLDELQVDQQSDELDFLQLTIAQAGIFSGSIDADDASSVSNSILARMELILNSAQAEMLKISTQKIKEARYVLDKKRREVARNAKLVEMTAHADKQAERRKVREERQNREKIIERPVVARGYIGERQKTTKQKELEARLLLEQMQGQGLEGDFY